MEIIWETVFFETFLLCAQVVQEYERAVIFRLGRLLSGGSKGPGEKWEKSETGSKLHGKWCVFLELFRYLLCAAVHRVISEGGPSDNHTGSSAAGGKEKDFFFFFKNIQKSSSVPYMAKKKYLFCTRCSQGTRWRCRWTPWSTTGCPTQPSPWPTWRTPTTPHDSWRKPRSETSWVQRRCTRSSATGRA